MRGGVEEQPPPPPQHPLSTPQINGLQPHDLAVDRKGRKLRDNSEKKDNSISHLFNQPYRHTKVHAGKVRSTSRSKLRMKY